MPNCFPGTMRGPFLLVLSALLMGMVSANFPAVIIRACVKDSKVKSVDLALLYGNELMPATQPAKCYLTCLFESIGITAGNKVNKGLLSDASNGEWGKSLMTNMIESCKDIEAAGECEIGYQLFSCMRSYGKSALTNKQSEDSNSE